MIPLICVAAIAFGGFYTPGMALVSDRAESAGLAQGLGFGIMNSAWASGNLTGPAVGGALASAFGDAVPYLAGGALCLLTLAGDDDGQAASRRGGRGGYRSSTHAASSGRRR